MKKKCFYWRFAINLQCGPGVNPRDDIALHLSPTLEENSWKIIRNSLQKQIWGLEEKFGDSNLKSEEPFEIMILIEEDHFKVEKFFNFNLKFFNLNLNFSDCNQRATFCGVQISDPEKFHKFDRHRWRSENFFNSRKFGAGAESKSNPNSKSRSFWVTWKITWNFAGRKIYSKTKHKFFVFIFYSFQKVEHLAPVGSKPYVYVEPYIAPPMAPMAPPGYYAPPQPQYYPPGYVVAPPPVYSVTVVEERVKIFLKKFLKRV